MVLQVKVSDFGLSRALGVGKDYYQTNFSVNLKLPLAWSVPYFFKLRTFFIEMQIFRLLIKYL